MEITESFTESGSEDGGSSENNDSYIELLLLKNLMFEKQLNEFSRINLKIKSPRLGNDLLCNRETTQSLQRNDLIPSKKVKRKSTKRPPLDKNREKMISPKRKTTVKASVLTPQVRKKAKALKQSIRSLSKIKRKDNIPSKV